LTVQQPQAQALANLLHQLRPDWNVTSIMALLGKHKDGHEFTALSLAAVKAAANPDTRTPAVIFLPGPHWAAGTPPQQFKTAAEKRLETTMQNARALRQMDAEREAEKPQIEGPK
jgi:LmbE family N-acetylglucosaminyl deacetylase